MPAFLEFGGERHSVQMLDLSAGGAKLNCPASVPIGTEATLDCGTFERPAIARWQNGEYLGVSFDRELNEREIGALLNRSTALTARKRNRD